MPTIPQTGLLYLGVDPGSSGGLVLLSGSGKVADLLIPSSGEALGIDCEKETATWIGQCGAYCAVIEQVGGWIPGREGAAHSGAPGSAMFTFGRSYGFLRGCLASAGIPFTSVVPRVWQREFSLRRTKGEKGPQYKRRIADRASELFPDAPVTLKTADALLIAEYCRRNYFLAKTC